MRTCCLRRLLPPVCPLPFPLFRLLLERWPTGSVWLSIRQRVSLRYLVAKPCVKARTASRCGPRSLLNHFYRTQSFSRLRTFWTTPPCPSSKLCSPWPFLVSEPVTVCRLDPSHMSCPTTYGSLAVRFTTIAPMVPVEHTALPEICDVAWQFLLTVWPANCDKAC